MPWCSTCKMNVIQSLLPSPISLLCPHCHCELSMTHPRPVIAIAGESTLTISQNISASPIPNTTVDELPIRNKPTSEYTLTMVPIIDPAEICPICKEDYEVSNSEARTMPCKHIFHSNCIASWLVKSKSCPVCRFNFCLTPVVNDANRERYQRLLDNYMNSVRGERNGHERYGYERTAADARALIIFVVIFFPSLWVFTYFLLQY